MTIEDNRPGLRLPPPLGVTPELVASAGRRIALHVAGPLRRTSPPLLLVHSVNAAASVIEMLPLFERQAQRRAVVALDLPGFGDSDRAADGYTPDLMVRAILDALDWMRRHVDPAPADLVALSLGCEFATLAALAEPGALRSLALISPTGMEGRHIGETFDDGRTRERASLARVLRRPAVGRVLYAALTTRASMAWFLTRTWGTSRFDESLLVYGRANARQPGARHAPLAFVAGSLFTRGVVDAYRRLALPVLVAHGLHGAFTDFEAFRHVTVNSPGRWKRRLFDGGAMPHMEMPVDFDAAYLTWLREQAPSPRRTSTGPLRDGGAHDRLHGQTPAHRPSAAAT